MDMNQPITEKFWKYYMGDVPMPEGATYESLNAALTTLEQVDEIEDALKNIADFEDIKSRWNMRYEMAKASKDLNEASRKEYEHVKYCMEAFDTIIEIYRERLNG